MREVNRVESFDEFVQQVINARVALKTLNAFGPYRLIVSPQIAERFSLTAGDRICDAVVVISGMPHDSVLEVDEK